MSTIYTYQVFLDGTLGGKEIWFWKNGRGPIPGPEEPAKVTKTSGGVIVTDGTEGPYEWVTSPNIWPAHAVGGQMGLTARLVTVDGVDQVDRAYIWNSARPEILAPSPPYPNTPVQYQLPVSAFSPVPSLPIPAITIKYFLKTFRLKTQWDDGATQVPLVGRAIYIGQNEFHYAWITQDEDLIWLHRTEYAGGCSPGPDYYDAGYGMFPYQLSDGSGVAEYIACMGCALEIPPFGGFTGTTYYYLVQPFGSSGPGDFSYNNVSLFVRQCELALFGDVQLAVRNEYPYEVDENHAYRQLMAGTFTPKTAGWDQDYGGAWDPATGILAVVEPAIVTHSYFQGVNVSPVDHVLTPIPASVTLTAYGPTGPATYTGTAGTQIDMLPNGSTLKDVRWQPGDGIHGETIPEISSIPLQDASNYYAASVEGILAQLVPPSALRPEVTVSSAGPGNGNGDRYDTRWTGKSGDTLTGVTAPHTHPDWPWESEAIFDGGEVLTQPYSYAWAEIGGLGRTGTGYVWVHEDGYEIVAPGENQPSTNAVVGGLDYALDPAGEPWLTEGTPTLVNEYTSNDMERVMSKRQIINEGMTSPSRVILADHEHILAGIDAAGAVKLWSTTTQAPETATPGTPAGSWNVLTTIDASTLWAGCVLREDPAGALHCFMVNPAGVVKKRISADGGATWDTLAVCAGLPVCRAERVDVLDLGNEWMAFVPDAGGQVALYSSPDGEAFVHETDVAATARYPWLVALEAGDLLCFWYDEATFEIKSARASEAAGVWTVTTPVVVATP